MSSSAIKSPSSASSVLQHGLVPGKTRIGWIGTGVMGVPMCGHVMKAVTAGYPTTVYNRSADKAAPLAAQGAKLASSVEEVARNSDVIFTIVGYPADVRQLYFGDHQQPGILNSMEAGGVCVDMTTSEPSLAKELAEVGNTKGIKVLDAPVSGGDVGAREARLSIMVGGEQVVMYAILPLLQSMGKTITYLGPSGSGQYTKGVNQILIANNMIGVCEGLLYGYRAGLDLTTVIQAIGSGAAASWSINNLGPRIIARNFAPGFIVDHFVKDMMICLAECSRMKLALPGLALAQQLYTALQAQGHARDGTHALMLAFEHLNAVQVPNDKPMIAPLLPNIPTEPSSTVTTTPSTSTTSTTTN